MAEETKSCSMYHDDMIFWTNGDREFALHVQQESDVQDPRRENDGYVGDMYCRYDRHALGDHPAKTEPHEFFADLIRKAMTMPEIAGMLDKNAAPGYLRIQGEPDDHFAGRFMEDLDHDDVAMRSCIDVLAGHAVVLPLYIYDHSGLTMSCGDRVYPYNDRWDSSHVGWIAVTKKDALENLGADESDWKEKAENCARAEVKEYDMYLTGDVYWFELKSRPLPDDGDIDWNRSDASQWDEENSCGGFYGSDILESGLAEHAGNGLCDAIESGSYRTGKASSRTIQIWTYNKDD